MTGQTISHYQILEKLGEGGMGVVYKARDTELGRFAAIKALPAGKVADPERLQRFLTEARAASALNHPNIVTIYDLIREGDNCYLVMEYIEGRTLESLIPNQGMRLNELLGISMQVAGAVAAAHAAGIVHRDLKPANVMVAAGGLAKVLDFGLAKLIEPVGLAEDSATLTLQAQTEKGAILGTVSYMSPEQAEGRPVDARSDIFSFAALLYEMLTGRKAFAEQTKIATLSAILHKEPKPLEELAPQAPVELTRLIGRCLRKNPDRRLKQMSDIRIVLEDLKEASDTGTVSGTLPAAARATGKKRWIWIAVAAVLAMAATGVGFWRGRQTDPAANKPMPLVPLTSYPGEESSPTFSPDGAQFAFAWNGEKQNNWDIYIRLVDGGSPLRLTSGPADERAPAWSPDGRWIAFTRQTGPRRNAVLLISPLGGPERQIAEVGTGFRGSTMAWTPDAKWLAFSDEKGLLLHSMEKGEQRRLTSDGDRRPNFSPDGRRLAFLRGAGTNTEDIYILELTGDMIAASDPSRFTTLNQSMGGLGWTPDGTGIVFFSGLLGNYQLWRQRLEEKKPAVIEGPGRFNLVGDLTISRQGRLAMATLDRRMQLARADLVAPEGPGFKISDIAPSTMIDRAPSFSPDSSRIAFLSDRSGGFDVWVCNAGGGNLAQVTSTGNVHESQPPVWSPDGKRIAFTTRSGAGGGLWTVSSTGGAPQRIGESQQNLSVSAWSLDGKWIYYFSGQALWRVPSGGGTASQVEGGSSIEPPPDGKYRYFVRDLRLIRRPAAGGAEEDLGPGGSLLTMAPKGFYFLTGNSNTRTGTLQYFPFPNGPAREVKGVESVSQYGMTVSQDGRTLLYTRMSEVKADILSIPNFRFE